MRKKKEKVWRRLMALLAVVCMLNGIFGESVIVCASEGTVSAGMETMEEAEREKTGQTEEPEKVETEDTGQTEEPGKETEDTGQTEGPEKETDGTEEVENPEEAEGTEDTEKKEGENPEEPGEKEDSKTVDGERTEKSSEDEEADKTEKTEEMEAAETEEVAEESLMLLLEETEDGENAAEESVTDASYTDENGIVYRYYGYEDGTANLYEITYYAGKDVNIPAYIDGYTVTQLTFRIWGEISSVTIPETVTYIGKIAFVDAEIGTLYYNAAAEVQVEPMPNAPFRHTKIGSLITGENVHIIPTNLFSFTEFQEDIAITAEVIGENAFNLASFQSLTLTKQIKKIQKEAFLGAKIQTLIYDTEAEHTVDNAIDGMFRAASIQELIIDESITHLPDYVFCRAAFGFQELTVNVERIGNHAFDRAWESEDKCCAELTLSESVKYIGADAFAYNHIAKLNLFANAESGASGKDDGCFYSGYIADLCIGEAVSAIPDYMFSTAHMTMDELVLNVESIGKYAFCRHMNVISLTIGEKVKEIGICAFEDDNIANLHFNALNAAVKGGIGETDYLNAPFKGVTFTGLFFGEQVTAIPEILFAGANYIADEIVFPDSLTTIGRHAFHSSGIQVGELTIGENITSIGKEAFTDCGLNVLNYHAVDAQLPGVTMANYYGNPFYLTRIGELRIGDRVRTLPDYLFYCARLTQDELTIPDSVVSIGTQVLSCSADSIGAGEISIGTLTIGENVSHIGAWAFGCGTYQKAVIYTNSSDSEVNTSFRYYLPVCGQVEIHGNSPYYAYFTNRSEEENITLMCETFETSYGKEIYDEEKGAFVTTVTERCVVCGYEKTWEESKTACTVIFKDYDDRELSKQYVVVGGNADAPEISERIGFNFTGWDKSFRNVTSDIIVTAQYEAKTFSVVFKDGENIVSEQKIAYECDAKLPKDPARLAETWGKWKFTGWNGNYQSVIQDEVLQAQFEKVLNEYEVTFYDAEGNVLNRQNVVHGEKAEVPDAPKKSATAQYIYTFTGWDKNTENITENMDVHPLYDAAVRFYTVTFMNDDTILDEQTVAYGKAAKAPENPTRPGEEWGTWEFAGWSGDYANVTADVIIRAQFEQIFHEYEVIFYDADGNILSRQTVAHGHAAKAPDAPEKEPAKEYCYSFTGWDGDIMNITGDTAFHPTYGTETRSYTVTFMNEEIVFNRQTVKYGESAVTPIEPKKEADAEYSYHFIGWDSDYSLITGDMVIHALYEQKELSQESGPEKEEDTGKEEPKKEESGSESEDKNGNESSGEIESVSDVEAGESTAPITEGNGWEKPGFGTEADKGEKQNSDISLTLLPGKQFQEDNASDRMPFWKLPSFITPETEESAEIQAGEQVTEELQEDTDSAGLPQETAAEDMTETSIGITVIGWILFLAGIFLLGFFFLWPAFLHSVRRKVCGTILGESGGAPGGIHLTLSGKDILETEPDAEGNFCFTGLKKSDYRFSVYDEDDNKIFSTDIHMKKGNGEAVFLVLASDCMKVETNRKRRTYEINLIV